MSSTVVVVRSAARRELEEDRRTEDDDVLCRCGQAFYPSIWRYGCLVVGDFGDQEEG
jgi:hypothetical protein